MTQEEKAKRYDEALKVLHKYDGVNIMFSQSLKEEMFPELKESEDDKIKNKLIKLIKMSNKVGGFALHKWEADEMLVWLEKQGKTSPVLSNSSNIGKVEQKPVEPQQDMLSQEKYAKAVDECIYGEQKPAEDKGMNLVEEEMTPFQKKVFCIIDTTIEEEQGLKQVCDELLRLAHDEIMQNTAWSEDDKRIIDNLVSQLCNLYARKLIKEETKDKYVDWLKSLKDRVLPQPQEQSQPKGLSDDFEEEMDRYIEENFYGSACDGFFSNRTKRELEVEDVVRIGCHFAAWQKEQSNKELSDKSKQEWSEADENHVKSILSTIECCKAQFPNAQAVVEAYNADIEWLNSLRPQNTWKPSEEQMDALEDAITDAISSIQKNMLNSLYSDLKKL